MATRRTLSPDEYGGFVLTFEPSRTESIAEILAVHGQVSESFSAEDWAFERCELVFLARRLPTVSVFAAALMRRMGGSGGTRRMRMRITEPLLFDPPIRVEELTSAGLVQSRLSSAETVNRYPASDWNQLLHQIKLARPEEADSIDDIVDARTEERRLIGEGDRIARLAEERDALGLALDIAQLDRREIFRQVPNGTLDSANSVLDLFESQPVAERSLLEHDARLFGEILADGFNQGRFGDRSGREVRTYVTDGTPIETATGVDLLIYQQSYNSFLMLQYKGMHENAVVPGWSYRVDGTNLDAQLGVMNSVRAALPWPGEAGGLRDQRLSDEPFYFKFCERTRPNARDDSLVAGLTMGAGHLEHFLSLPEATQEGAGRRVGYRNCPRYLNNTEFVSLARGGWIGCTSATTEVVTQILRAREHGRVAIVTVIQGLAELQASQRGRVR